MPAKVIAEFPCGCGNPDCCTRMSVVDMPSEPNLVRLVLAGQHSSESFLLTKADMPAFINAVKQALDEHVAAGEKGG
jgi:hypothetical protein